MSTKEIPASTSESNIISEGIDPSLVAIEAARQAVVIAGNERQDSMQDVINIQSLESAIAQQTDNIPPSDQSKSALLGSNVTSREIPKKKFNYDYDYVPDLERDPLAIYKRQIGAIDLLTPSDEIDLAIKIERGDLEAKDRMITANLRLVLHRAVKYKGLGMSLDDLVQEGTLGLIRATEKFDYRKGFRFSTYAVLWIRQSILRVLINDGRNIRLPVHLSEDVIKLRKATEFLVVALGRDPNSHELTEFLEWDDKKYLEAHVADQSESSLYSRIGEEQDSELVDFVVDSRADTFEEASNNLLGEMPKPIKTASENTAELNREILTLYYIDKKPMSLICKELELPPSYVRKQLKDGREKMRLIANIPKNETLAA